MVFYRLFGVDTLKVTNESGYTDEDMVVIAAAGQHPISPVPDQDEDGEPDLTDRCPNTQLGIEVDSNGCSLWQFCSAIDTSMDHGRQICNRSDWKNDEPLNNIGDCKAIKQGKGQSNYSCVPR